MMAWCIVINAELKFQIMQTFAIIVETK